jgi:hypothetical protein
MKKFIKTFLLIIPMLLLFETGASGATATSRTASGEPKDINRSVFVWTSQTLEPITTWELAEIVVSPLKGNLQVQARGACRLSYYVKVKYLEILNPGKCVVSASLKTTGSKKEWKESKTYLVGPSSIPALVAGIPWPNGVQITKSPYKGDSSIFPEFVYSEKVSSNLKPYCKSNCWSISNVKNELKNGYFVIHRAIWSCPADCDWEPMVSYFESQGYSLRPVTEERLNGVGRFEPYTGRPDVNSESNVYMCKGAIDIEIKKIIESEKLDEAEVPRMIQIDSWRNRHVDSNARDQCSSLLDSTTP